jgi:hypothetical protein
LILHNPSLKLRFYILMPWGALKVSIVVPFYIIFE